MSFTSSKTVGNEHQEWLSKIEFYKDDFIVLQKRLDEIVVKNNSKEVMVEVEHFQNQFILYREQFDEMRHNINEHMNKFKSDVEHHAGHVDTTLVANHEKMGSDVATLEKVINEIRHDFNLFLAKWM